MKKPAWVDLRVQVTKWRNIYVSIQFAHRVHSYPTKKLKDPSASAGSISLTYSDMTPDRSNFHKANILRFCAACSAANQSDQCNIDVFGVGFEDLRIDFWTPILFDRLVVL